MSLQCLGGFLPATRGFFLPNCESGFIFWRINLLCLSTLMKIGCWKTMEEFFALICKHGFHPHSRQKLEWCQIKHFPRPLSTHAFIWEFLSHKVIESIQLDGNLQNQLKNLRSVYFYYCLIHYLKTNVYTGSRLCAKDADTAKVPLHVTAKSYPLTLRITQILVTSVRYTVPLQHAAARTRWGPWAKFYQGLAYWPPTALRRPRHTSLCWRRSNCIKVYVCDVKLIRLVVTPAWITFIASLGHNRSYVDVTPLVDDSVPWKMPEETSWKSKICMKAKINKNVHRLTYHSCGIVSSFSLCRRCNLQ